MLFGTTAFSQAPFSALAQNTFFASISEEVNCSAIESCVGTFLASQAETIQLNDAVNGARFVFVVIAESANFSSTEVVQTVFDGQIDEDVQLNAVISSTTNAPAV